MAERPKILVTGGTGRIGRHLLRVLAEKGVPARALSRDPDRGEALPGIEWAAGDLADPASLGSAGDAFAGVERLFLLTGNVGAMVRLQTNALRVAREAGVLHVVKLSALGASNHSKSLIGLWHWVVERELRASGMAWTILRPHHFMQNFLDTPGLHRGILKEGLVRSASGEGKIPFVDTRDIAEVAAGALTGSPGPGGRGHGGRTYTLTGPEALSYGQATEILSQETGRRLRFVAESPEEARSRMASQGLPDWLIAAQLAIAGYQRAGGATEQTTDTVEEILGRPARTFRDFARDHAGAFRG